MLLMQLKYPERFRSMCALAPAVDWDASFLLPGLADGVLEKRGDDVMVGIAPLPRTLVDSMALHRVLDSPLELAAPLHIIHGEIDRDAPIAVAERLCRHAIGAQCSLERLSGDDHGLAKLETKASRLSFERWLYHALMAAKAAG